MSRLEMMALKKVLLAFLLLEFIKCSDISVHIEDRHKREFDWDNAATGAAIGSIGGPIGAAIGGLVGGFWCDWFSCPEGIDTTPPTLYCVDIPNHEIPEGERTVVASWEIPTSGDPNAAIKHFGNADIGDTLKEGTYQVGYVAQNSYGINSEPCILNFTVILIECGFPEDPSRGSVDCSSGNEKPAYGETCTFTCEAGYELIGESKQTCREDAEYAGGGKIECQKIQCGKINLNDSMTQTHCSNADYFESVCSMDCIEGYDTPVNTTNQLECGHDKKWKGKLVPCLDVQPPVFDTCPGTMSVFTERGEKYGIATWDVPTASDPQGGPVRIYRTLGKDPGEQFPLNDTIDNIYHIVYSALDDQANEAEQCEFAVIIQERVCPPYPYSERLNVTCYDDFIWGSYCDLECDRGYPLQGNSTVYCEETADGRDLEWDWIDEPPFCFYIDCPDLDPPINGGLACTGWTHGTHCQMQCNIKWDIPLTVVTSAVFVCDDTTGLWFPTNLVPDCTEKRRPGEMNLPSELFYFSGDCTASTTQNEIRENYIAHLNTSMYNAYCRNYDECGVDNVKVTCGSVSGNGKRSTYTHRIRIDFQFTLQLEYPDDFTSEDYSSYATDMDDKLYEMADLFKEDVTQGVMDLNIVGLETETDVNSYQYGWTELLCELGTTPRWSTFSCASCPTGTKYNSDIDDCEPCPVGAYQDESGQLTCKQCPSYTSTHQTGSKSTDQCVDMCNYGYYSDTGLEGCARCPVGTYQNERAATYCTHCPADTTTLSAGSTDIQLCITNDAIQTLALCNRTRCNGGFCLIDSDASMRCVCSGGFTGEVCDKPPDPCAGHLCQHGGSCEATQTTYSCSCIDGFTGTYCQDEIINGDYTQWTMWTDCSVTCGSGTIKRERACVNPAPGPGGLPCQGEELETQTCNIQDCPACNPTSIQYWPYGHNTTCSEVGNDQICEMKCRDGMVLRLLSNMKPNLTCGESTDYVWSYGIGEPADINYLPKCAATSLADDVSMRLTLVNPDVDCSKTVDTNPIKTLADENTNCSQTGLCEVYVTTECSTSAVRRKRGTGNVVVIVHLDGSFTNPDYFPGGVYDNDIATIAANELTEIAAQMSNVVQWFQKAQAEGTLFISADGQNYVPTMTVGAVMECPPGMVPLYGLCTSCPIGTHQTSSKCQLCDTGYYQDEDGKTQCKKCPVGFTTPEVGAESNTECSVTDTNDDDSTENNDSPTDNNERPTGDNDGPTDNNRPDGNNDSPTYNNNGQGGSNNGPPSNSNGQIGNGESRHTTSASIGEVTVDEVTQIQRQKSLLGPIIGGVVCGVFVLAAIVCGIIIWKKKKSKKSKDSDSHENMVYGIDEKANGATPESTVYAAIKTTSYPPNRHSVNKQTQPKQNNSQTDVAKLCAVDTNETLVPITSDMNSISCNQFGTENQRVVDVDAYGSRPCTAGSITVALSSRLGSSVSLAMSEQVPNPCTKID